MKATTETMAAFVAAIGGFPAQVVVRNNTWKPFVESWTATEVGPYSAAPVRAANADVLQRMVSNIEAHNALSWPDSDDAVSVLAVEAEPAALVEPVAPEPAADPVPAAVEVPAPAAPAAPETPEVQAPPAAPVKPSKKPAK